MFNETSKEQHLTIREWSVDDRPREKMLAQGAAGLSDAELLAIVLASGSKNESAVDLARRILVSCHQNLNELARLSVAQLTKSFRGVGKVKALTIMAALELGKRRTTTERLTRKIIVNSKELSDLFEPYLLDLPHEEFWVAYLNNANAVLETSRLTQGGRQHTVVDVPMLLKHALETGASAIAVAHNHPSGLNRPSREDEKVTQMVKTGCEAVGLRFLDHIIIANGNYYSFCDEGKA